MTRITLHSAPGNMGDNPDFELFVAIAQEHFAQFDLSVDVRPFDGVDKFRHAITEELFNDILTDVWQAYCCQA